MLTTKHLYKSVAKKVLCHDINIKVKQGQITGLFGPNGSGKSTFFHMISGFMFPTSGAIFLHGKDITHIPIHQRSHLGLSFLPQDSSIFEELSVYENIYATMELYYPRPVCARKTLTFLEDFQLEHVADTKAGLVSGGERRRAEIARACVCNPKFLLLDEPFAGVDPISIEEIKLLLSNIASAKNIGIFITDHNVSATIHFCDYTYVFFQGQMLASGIPSDILQNGDVKRHYLGSTFS